MLGIGSGGVLVAISRRMRRASTDAILMWSLLLGAASVGVGYLIVAVTRTDSLTLWDYGTSDSLTSLARLVLICLVLFASFIAVGVVLATLFGRRSDEIGRLYFADLVGAGIACAVVVALIGWIGPPATIMLAGLVLALAGLRLAARRRSRALPLAGVVAAVLAVVVVAPSLLPRQRTDAFKGDVDESKTSQINAGKSYIPDVAEAELAKAVKAGKLRATTDMKQLGEMDAGIDGDARQSKAAQIVHPAREIDVVIFDLCAPVAADGEFDAGAGGPAGLIVADP